MQRHHATGPKAAVLKYDLLTALGAHACAGDKHLQRLTLRFITLIVARYNWQTDELATGQKEMAALWSVDERTVKRDMARLRDLGWLIVKRAAARGRVAVYRLGAGAILAVTAPDWGRVGSDYLARMTGSEPEAVPASNVITFPGPPRDEGLWPDVQRQLHQDNPALHAAWFAMLRPEMQGAVLVLHAPTRFHASFVTTHHLPRLVALVRARAPEVTGVQVLG